MQGCTEPLDLAFCYSVLPLISNHNCQLSCPAKPRLTIPFRVPVNFSTWKNSRNVVLGPFMPVEINISPRYLSFCAARPLEKSSNTGSNCLGFTRVGSQQPS